MTRWINESKGGPFLTAESKRFKKDHEKERPNPNWVAHPAITYDSDWIEQLRKANPDLFKKLPYWDDAPVWPLKYDYSGVAYSFRDFAAQTLLKETMGEEKYNHLQKNGSLVVTGSNGKNWTIYKNGVVVNPAGITGRVVYHWFPLGDALVALYLNILKNAAQVEDRWGCGNLALTYRGKME